MARAKPGAKPGASIAWKHQNTLATTIGGPRGQAVSAHPTRTYGRGRNSAEYIDIIQDTPPSKKRKLDHEAHELFPVHHRDPYMVKDDHATRPISSLIDDDIQEITSPHYQQSPVNRNPRRTGQLRLQDAAVSGSGEYRKTEERMSAKTQSMPQDDFAIRGASSTNPSSQRPTAQVVIRQPASQTIESDSDSEFREGQYPLITNQRTRKPGRPNGDSSMKSASNRNEPSRGIPIKGISDKRNNGKGGNTSPNRSRDRRSATVESDGSGNNTDELQQDTPEGQSYVVNRSANSRSVKRNTSDLVPLGDDIPASEIRSSSPSKRNHNLKLSPTLKAKVHTRNLQFFRVAGQVWTEPKLSITLNKGENTFDVIKVSSDSPLKRFQIARNRVNHLVCAIDHTAVRLVGPRDAMTSRSYYFHLRFENVDDSSWFRDQVNLVWPNGIRVKLISE
jgi:hypothetical protein